MNKTRRRLFSGAATGFGALLWATANAATSPVPTGKKERVIKVQAKKFVYTPNRIVLKQGESVVLEFTALDFMHGFKIPDWNIRADLMPGQVTRVSLKPDNAGEFDFLCDNFCGSGHEEMGGKIVVTV
ncbi:MAG TPA: cupredoxin domain-containing protein [Burkholderiaceae bacterium]|jgi:cytochrome c oxidase subunit 2|nr:cupredoxin domain-containing protein [Burkholderiaceae bacterium]